MKKKHDLLYILSVLLVVLLCWYVSKYHYQLMLVDGQSMEPTFRDKSVVLLDKHASERRTGDVVYCRCESVGRYIVKRIAAVPGDSIRAQDGVLYINGLPSVPLPPEDFRAEYINDDDTLIPDGMYFLLGDNTEKSVDSRYALVGLMPEECILARVITKK